LERNPSPQLPPSPGQPCSDLLHLLAPLSLGHPFLEHPCNLDRRSQILSLEKQRNLSQEMADTSAACWNDRKRRPGYCQPIQVAEPTSCQH
jgi:hypothetical protein